MNVCLFVRIVIINSLQECNMNLRKQILLSAIMVSMIIVSVNAQENEMIRRLKGFDPYMEKILKDWNAPGISVGIVYKNRLIHAKGYGYRDYGKKLPMTARTLMPIASNTKLFTSVAAGCLVEEGKIAWDKPVKQYIPSVEFFSQELNNTVTLRDMLSHRTGISRHDLIWYRSDFSRKELFERLKYLEPSLPLRTGFLYNNMMYAASGYIIEQLSGKTWEEYLTAKVFKPLEMNSTVFRIDDMKKFPEFGVPYSEKRDTAMLQAIPYYEEADGVGPAGSIISNTEDISKWLIALMNRGQYNGQQVIASNAVKATLEPAMALPNTGLETRGYKELINSVYGMGRWYASYRGHYLTYHGGDIDGFHSQISMMPYDSIGVVVFVIGDHCGSLYNTITYNVYERLLGMDLTPWSERRLDDRKKSLAAGKEARDQSGSTKITNTKPSHSLEDFAGMYEHPAYGILNIRHDKDQLHFDYRKINLPLNHYHYDIFDTPEDERTGKWVVSFYTNPQGDVHQAVMSLDEKEVTFTRKPDVSLTDMNTLRIYTGQYLLPNGAVVETQLKGDGFLYLVIPGQPPIQLIPYKKHRFKVREYSDLMFEFVMGDQVVTAMKQVDPSGVYEFKRK